IRDSIVAALTSDKTIVPMDGTSSADNPFAPPEPASRVPDAWASEDPIARAPFSLGSIPQTVAGYEVPLGLSFRTEPSTSVTYPEFDKVRSEVRPLGQLRDSFIVATDLTGLIVIDQHVAHERVLFENYLRQKLAGKLDIQRLLIPIIVQLPPRQLVILDTIIPELARNGFEVEPFGPKTIAIK